jgi:NAD(P)-dependent dehydrogenase (short-subunit alcohol dehydrogenase family)
MQWDDLNWEKTPYSAIGAYSQSKLANILFTKELARKGEGSGVTAYALHPGVIATDLGRHMEDMNYFTKMIWRCSSHLIKTPDSGANTTIYCAIEPSLAEHNGKYYSDCSEVRPSAQAENMEDAKKLWDLSEQMVKLNQA